jgi:hypothetical protein
MCSSQLCKNIYMLSMIWMHWTCLLPCLAAMWFQNGILSSCVLMASVSISRLGLWMFDLSVLQQMQARSNPYNGSHYFNCLLSNFCNKYVWYIKVPILHNHVSLIILFQFFKIEPCSWIRSFDCWRCSEFTSVIYGFIGLCYGNNNIWSTGEFKNSNYSFPT